MSLCLISPCFHISISPCFHVSISMFTEFLKQKAELTENFNIHLFAANRKRKRQTSVCLLQTETENGSLFSLVGKGQTVIGNYCFSKLAYLCARYTVAPFVRPWSFCSTKLIGATGNYLCLYLEYQLVLASCLAPVLA